MFSFIILVFELIGTVAFSISGAMVGLRKKMDIFGIFILGLCTAVGGGVIRDLVLGRTPPASFVHPVYAVTALLSATLTFFPAWTRLIGHNQPLYEKMMLVMDSLGLGIFTVVGVHAAYAAVYEPSLYLLIFVGVITGVGGGMLRDVLAGDPPYIFRKHFYACASIIGAFVYVTVWTIGVKLTGGAGGTNLHPVSFVTGVGEQIQYAAMAAGTLTVFVLRMLAAHFEWSLPHP